MVLAVEDIIREMRERPEVLDSIRRLILTDELLELPERFSKLTGRFDMLTERFDALTRVTEKNSADIADLTVAVRKNSADIADLTVAVQKNTADIAELTVAVRKNTADIAELNVAVQKNSDAIAELTVAVQKNSAAIAELTVAVQKNSDDIAELTVAVAENTASIKRIDDTMGYYGGLFLEHSMPKILVPRLSQELSLRSPRVQYHHNLWPSAVYSFIDRVDGLWDDGAITEAQRSRLILTDMIMSARRQSDGEEVWIAAEASGLIAEKDIDRASESAQIIAHAFKTDTRAIVIGHRISDIDRFRADQKDVTVILADRSEI